MDNLVKTNAYRVTEKCPNCPFRTDGNAIRLAHGRLRQIKHDLLTNDMGSFTCHKTGHNLDLNMKSTKYQEPKMCAGAYEFLIEQGRPNYMMRLAQAMGVENE